MVATPTPLPKVPGYRIERILGRGGMGTVYLATQLSLGRPVALKVLHPNRVRNPADAEAFFQEALAAGRLNHPSLVTIHDVIQDPAQGIHAYAMQYVEGRTAGAVVREDGPLPRPAALRLIGQAAAALAVAHAQGFVHRDVKPDNLLVTPRHEVKLLDLGLAYNRLGGLTGGPATPGHRRLVLIGTPEFAAPEQCRNPDEADPTADVWALGATLHVLLTGRPPFEGVTVIDLIVRAATEPLAMVDGLDRDCADLLNILMAKDPDHRYADAMDAAEAIAAVVAGRPAPRVVATPEAPRRRQPPRRRMR